MTLPIADIARSRKPDEAFRIARLQIEKAGVPVIAERVAGESFRGFCLAPDNPKPPIIFINTLGQLPATKLFTLIHEFVHVFVRATGVSDPFVLRNKLERYCNKITEEFLLPTKQFSEIFQYYRRRDPDLPPRQIVDAISGHFGASKQATAIRIEELNLDSSDFYNQWLGSYPGGYSSDFVDSVKSDEEQEDLENESTTSGGGGGVYSAVIGKMATIARRAF